MTKADPTVSTFALPRLAVEVAGRALPERELSALTTIRICHRLSRPSQCELTFLEPEGGSGLIAAVGGGLSLGVRLCDKGLTLFAGEVTAVEYVFEGDQGRQFRVRGYDVLHRLRERQQLRAWSGLDLAELAQELVGDLGVTVRLGRSLPRWRRIIQSGQTDFELLAERARACGIYFSLDGTELILQALDGVGEAVPLRLGRELLEARVELNGQGACRSVTVNGWNPNRVETHIGTASLPRSGREIAAEMPPDRVGGAVERALATGVLEAGPQAEARAQAELDLRVAREVTFWGVANGDARLRPGGLIAIGGLAAPINGRYVLTEVTHTFDAEHGFISEITTLPPPDPVVPPGSRVLPGHVTRVDDPDSLGRVQVSLPSLGGVETDWVEVLAPMAGARKGMMMMPDVGDQVLLLCADHNPANGVVLGSLFGAGERPDAGADGNAIRRYTFLTPSGQELQFDESAQAIRVKDARGSLLEMTAERVRLHSKVPLDLEAPGQPVRIRGKAIDFEEA